MGKKIKISKVEKEDKPKSAMTTKKRAKILNKRKTNKKEISNELDNSNINPFNNELKISLYPDKKPRYEFERDPVKDLIDTDTLAHSFDINQELAGIYSNVPVLEGFYTAHTNHYPLRITPDDIWLLIVQAFSNHVNANYQELRKYFVDFNGKKELIIDDDNAYFFKDIKRENLEKFTEKIIEKLKEHLGKEIVDLLTPEFTTTTQDSVIICNLTIMCAFKKYFEYKMRTAGCGIPYIILEGTVEDYKKIKSKAAELSKYQFSWYIDRITPHIEKMIEAKEGKIDTKYFKNFIQKDEVTEYIPHSGRPEKSSVDEISGWFLSFFAYYNKVDEQGNFIQFNGNYIKVSKFSSLANQRLIVPFTITERLNNNKQHLMKFEVGFVGCDQNAKKEVFPVKGWIVSPSSKEERDSIF